ncbi:hypothetical protein L3V64_008755 [Geobacillus stearothermophilus]|uniref:hypothetical protein n=1 Tax=Geobacillus stearothermophilus TaxID=1422 RepID=UPI00064A06EE|nr:hypothetical protein [Geobacillus stearothermophilus]AKM19126.1 hypothetical protein GARCT_01853 [Geobacillus sp. 12AMOR1]STO12289.1 Uncharacterised protein [[Flavobacterium] thermophilum]MCK7606420.1 hypothetical protein [Geobacillus stearothermophilus]WJP98952.1 hypothetical protein QT234_09425 [Geobacillus stearothermophilus]WJQ02243.1 hypothetical protein QT236_09055 [Geobacillus stearothermophilus]
MNELYQQLSAWIEEKQPVRVQTEQGEAVVLPVKLYQEARKLFVYNRQMRLMNIPLDRIISVEPTRIIGSFDRRGEEAMVHTR